MEKLLKSEEDQIGIYQSAMQVEGVVLNPGDAFGKPFLLVLDSI